MRMRSLFAALLMLGTVSLPALATGETIYTGVTILDPLTKHRLPDRYVVVLGERIETIGQGRVPRRYAGAARAKMTGRFAMPGLFDTHAHITLGPVTPQVNDGAVSLMVAGSDAITRHDALMLLAAGVTTIRDPGGDTARAVAYRDAVKAGRLRGPEAKVAGAVIDRSAFPVRGLVDRVDDTHDVAGYVQAQARAGVNYVKLYEALTPSDLASGIQAANAAGVTTIAHLGDVSWAEAARLGIDSLVHAMPISPYLLPSDRRAAYLAQRRPGPYAFFEWYEQADLDGPEITTMIRTVAEKRIPVDATLIAFNLAFHGDDLAYRDRDVAWAYPAMVENWKTAFRFDLGWKSDDYTRAQAVWPKVQRFVRMLHEAGVPLTIGTDMNNPFVAPGVSVAREAELHVAAGIPAWDVLRMATSNAAHLLKLDDRTGRLQSGMEADILFLDADPSIDIHALSQVTGVVENGRYHRPADLKAEAKR
ncbi:amidohydrolase family protein [Nevskia ramosa]|uniref:amidohydrolase family protein n=1 Tax=Nevskia ramosa TaxID=64002 RepID=UPI0003B4E7F0|nr:amidohydrolase family protein [Nevskia ramosa]